MKTISALVLSAVALSPLAVHAQDSNWYAVLSIGQSTYDADKSDFDDAAADAGLGISSSKLDDNDTGYKVQAGYKFNENFAVEGGYVDLGRLTLSADLAPEAPITSGHVGADVKAYGFNVEAVGILPLGSGFSVFAKAGAILAITDSDVSAVASGQGVSASVDDDNSDTSFKPTAGVGAAFDLNETLSVRLEYERFFDLKVDSDGFDADLASIGLVARF
jgi:OOP family OmpA-OmpF porin